MKSNMYSENKEHAYYCDMASKTEKPAPNLHGNLIDENKWAPYNCKFNHDFLDIERNLKPLENIDREKIFPEIQSFQIPLELLEKDELVAYVRILENCLHRCQQKFKQRDSDWQSSSHCRSDKAAVSSELIEESQVRC